MRTPSTAACVLVLLLGAAWLPAAAKAAALKGQVVAISDGDTITVLDADRRQHRIRLAGIDAPEKGQPFGWRSRQSLAGMVFGKAVIVQWEKRDQYDRVLGRIKVEATQMDVNLEQIKSGMAWHYRHYAKDQPDAERTAYAQAEQQARKQNVGLWADKNPVPPWEWRRLRR